MNALKIGGPVILVALLSACGTSKSYFSTDVRTRVEKNSVSVEKLQFYIDRNVELRREVTSKDTKVTSGKVKLVNGKYVNIIKLKKNTPGVCTGFYSNALNIAFEKGDGQYLSFGIPTNGEYSNVYQIVGQPWTNGQQKVFYEGNSYYIQPGGTGAKLLINKSVTDKFGVKTRTMKGRTLDSHE
jgi:hypothetical protein